jgi:Cu/Ag efflux protein CusF
MKHRIMVCAVLAATAVSLHVDRIQAFSPANHPLAGVQRPELSLVQIQDQPNSLFRGIGVVTAIDPETGSLTINHQEIKGLMPAMEMLFRVNPRSLSDGVKAGDKIEFSVEDKTYTIRDLKVIEHAK